MRRTIIIGAGPGGICAGKRLKDAGYDDFLILEQAAGLGGTWFHNSYPGCRCDVPSHLYSFSFAPKPDWSEPYASQDEIRAYLEECAEVFGLHPHLRLNTRVAAASYDEATATWTLTTADGEFLSADFVISAVGLFNLPAYPQIPGLDTFTGPVVHSARWDHRLDLDGKAIGVIGSAASAVQIVPEIARIAGSLTVYQRTANHVGPRQMQFSEEFLQACKADPAAAVKAERQRISDWIDAVCTMDKPDVMAMMAAACAENLSQVEDPEVRHKLTPDHPFGSKRGLVSSDWYPTFNRPNVTLMTEPIDHITASAIVTKDGQSHPTEVIILATGFQTTRFLSVIPVTGRAGVRLDDAWAGGAQAYLGITVAGFPNLFMLYGPNTNNGSIINNIECQVNYILRKMQEMERHRLQWIDIKPEAMAAYNAGLQADLAKVGVWQSGVRDYYRSESGLIVTQWPHSMMRYTTETERSDLPAYNAAALPDAPIKRSANLNPA